MNTDRVTVLSKAEIVDSPTPVRPNYKMNILLAFGAALMTGIALAFFLDFIDDTVARPSQVEKEAGFIYLGSIEQMKHTAFLIEPIQGEAGIVIPPEGFLKQAAEVCKERNVLFIADEIQSGLARTGKMFASDWEDVTPDMYILGKALGGGVFPISCIAANRDVLGVFNPGSHGSTFGGNPLACAVSIAALEVLEDERLAERSLELGEYFLRTAQEKRWEFWGSTLMLP